MIIDSHQHFWNYNPERDTWIDESMQALKKNFLPENLKPILSVIEASFSFGFSKLSTHFLYKGV